MDAPVITEANQEVNQASITCTNCWKTSYHPKDIEHGFCGNCNQYFPDGVVCRDARHALKARYVHVWGKDEIAVIIRTDDASISIPNRYRMPHKHIDRYIDVLKVANIECYRIMGRKPDGRKQ